VSFEGVLRGREKKPSDLDVPLGGGRLGKIPGISMLRWRKSRRGVNQKVRTYKGLSEGPRKAGGGAKRKQPVGKGGS